ncbi:hypothetical protein Ddye_021585 [Dipteronia dyeriana]|uniref:Uncharacterized protein n=1 Tax=Dipteronia dyeriana TaxID=168575 RepID=A0AAD9U2Y3_9ROSI|nr:hypothetical protein Ddye_021585 [Dipteronia dyeriana]
MGEGYSMNLRSEGGSLMVGIEHEAHKGVLLTSMQSWHMVKWDLKQVPILIGIMGLSVYPHVNGDLIPIFQDTRLPPTLFGMVAGKCVLLEMYRNCAGFFTLLKESIESTVDESGVEKRENGEIFEMKLALNLVKSLSENQAILA